MAGIITTSSYGNRPTPAATTAPAALPNNLLDRKSAERRLTEVENTLSALSVTSINQTSPQDDGGLGTYLRTIRAVTPTGVAATDTSRLLDAIARVGGLGEVQVKSGTALTSAPLLIPNYTVLSAHPNTAIRAVLTYFPDNTYATISVHGVWGDQISTITAQPAYGSHVVSAVASGGVNIFPKNSWIVLYDTNHLDRLELHQVVHVSGSGPYLLTLDRPIRLDLPIATTIIATASPTLGVKLLGNGARLFGGSGTYDGVAVGVNRYIEVIRSADVYASGWRFDAVTDGPPSERGLSIDAPSYRVIFEDFHIDSDIDNPMILGASFESSDDSVMRLFQVRGCGTGIFIQDGRSCLVQDTKSTGNTGPGCLIGTATDGNGDLTKGSDSCAIIGGDYSGNGSHGIQIEYGSNNTLISGARLLGNTNSGVSIQPGAFTCSGTKITDCDIRNNGSSGVDCSSSAANTQISGGVIDGNVTGIDVQTGSTGTKIVGVHLGTNTTGVLSAASVDIVGCTGSAPTTVVSVTAGNAKMRGCRFVSLAACNMIQVASGSSLDVDQCDIQGFNGALGIVALGSAVVRGSQVTMTGFGGGGIPFYPAGAASKMMMRDSKASAAPLVTAGAAFNGQVILAYSASMTVDVYLVESVDITASNGSAFTINAPTNPMVGQRVMFRINNTSGGALGTATWNAIFKMATWTQPATGFNRWIQFEYNGTSWRECGRAAADIAN